MQFRKGCLVLGIVAAWHVGVGLQGSAAELRVGAATISITPDRPVALAGQMHLRIARNVESPVMATALALESRAGDQVLDQAILVSCDLVAIREGLPEKVRERLRERVPDFDADKLVLSATHTHTAPVMREGRYEIPPEVMQPCEYVEFAADRLSEVVVKAWEGRKAGGVGWGLGHAVVAYNRRVVYTNGQAQMYGASNRPDFRGIEGYEDHGVEILFFYDGQDNLIATAINLACPSQEVEGRSAINADFWHEVREMLRERHGPELMVLAWTGAAGDQSPRPMFRKAAEERMRQLRGLTRLDELARRIVRAWDDAYEAAGREIHRDVTLKHRVECIELPPRLVSEAEAAQARRQAEQLSQDAGQRVRMLWHQRVVERYEQQQAGTPEPYQMELHAIRLGDVAIATNDFELFTDFGIQIKARSPAVQTFLIQLAGPGSYLPTERAVRGGGYSAVAESSSVGPEGGQVLVDRTVEAIGVLFAETKP